MHRRGNRENNYFTCKGLLIDSMHGAKPPFKCSGRPRANEALSLGSHDAAAGTHFRIEPNAFLATRKRRKARQFRDFRPCEINSFNLHVLFAPHEIEPICSLVEVVQQCAANTKRVPSPGGMRLDMRRSSAPLKQRPRTECDYHADAMEAKKTKSDIMQLRLKSRRVKSPTLCII